MMFRAASFIFTGFLLLLVHCPSLFADDDAAPCRSARENWSKAFNLLKERTDALRDAKEHGVTQAIEEKLSGQKQSGPIARAVRSVLDQRRKSMDEARFGCGEVAEMERIAFEDWRRCSVGRQGPRGSSSPERPEAVLQERNKLLSLLSELMLDEAYAQYRTSHPVHTRENSGHGSGDAYASGPTRSRSGTRRAPGDSDQFAGYGNTYPGYYR